MATVKDDQPVKLTAAQLKRKVETLDEKVKSLKAGAWCYLCDSHKIKDSFYSSTDPMSKSGLTPICKECARKIALRVVNGKEQGATKDSVRLALRYLNKPFLERVWDSSIQEVENLASGKVKSNVWAAYIRQISMPNYIGMTYFDSDGLTSNESNNESSSNDITADELVESHVGMDTYDSFLKNKNDVIRLLNYDPFEKEDVIDQPFLYSQLLGLLDSGEDGNEDMMRTSSAISIVRGFLQLAKIDDNIAKLMSDINNIGTNSATIKSLQESKAKITSVITSLAQDSCISLKHNKNAKKGENTWTGKIKKIKELNLREGEVNGFDMETCKAMRQVMDLSNASIMKTLNLDESEWSDMVAEQRKMITDLQYKLDKYIEISRILLRENLDIKDYLRDNSVSLNMNLVNLNDLYSCFSELEHDDQFEECDTSEEVPPDEI
uniref:Uncharacterized protein n=1 Tax=Siphoviridae sp. ctL0q1 TaxID=2825449 RepID=A0A8S5PKK7_9CAUD|nr:MAG TPA: hypothetical protein [Siphoviridae sp. ctL0q1]